MHSNSKQQYIKRGFLFFSLLCLLLLTACQPKDERAIEEPPDVEASASLKNPVSELYLNISQYEKFYRDVRIQSKKAVTLHALSEAIQVHALLEYLEQQDIVFDDERKDFQRKQLEEQLAYDLQQPDFKRYFDELQNALNITEKDYIEHYLLVNKIYEKLKNDMFTSGIGLEEDETDFASYPSSDQEQPYRKKMGLSFDYVEYLAESLPSHLQDRTAELAIPFDVNYLKFTKNRNGELILASKEFSALDLTDDQYRLIKSLEWESNLQELARYNFASYKSLLQEIVANKTENEDLAQQLLAIFTVVETTMDFEFGDLVVYNNEMPIFDKSQLQTHKDITRQLIEYNFYQQSEQIPQAFYAYRYATEQIVEMYGLMNYLQQDYNVTLNDQTLQRIRTEQEHMLNEQLEDAYFKVYMDELLATFDLSLDTYIDDYLVVIETYNELVNQMQQQHIGLDIDGRYNKGDVNARYRNAAQQSWEQQFEMMEQLKPATKIQALDPQPEVHFEIPEGLEIGLNDDGQYVFTDVIGYLPMWLNESQQTFLAQLKRDNALPELSRYSIAHYLACLEKTVNSAMQQQLLELITIYQDSLAL